MVKDSGFKTFDRWWDDSYFFWFFLLYTMALYRIGDLFYRIILTYLGINTPKLNDSLQILEFILYSVFMALFIGVGWYLMEVLGVSRITPLDYIFN